MVLIVLRIPGHPNLIPPLYLASQREVQDNCFNDYKDPWKKTHSNLTLKKSSFFHVNYIIENHRRIITIQNNSNNLTVPMLLLSLKSAQITSMADPSSRHLICVNRFHLPPIFFLLDIKFLTPAHQVHLPLLIWHLARTYPPHPVQSVPLLEKEDTRSLEPVLYQSTTKCNTTIKCCPLETCNRQLYPPGPTQVSACCPAQTAWVS